MVAGSIEECRDARRTPVQAAFADARATHPRAPLQALHAALLTLSASGTGGPPVGWARTDPADPTRLPATVRDGEALRTGIVALLEAAVEQAALRPGTDVDRLARAVHVAQQGSVAVWATVGRGPFAPALRQDVDAALAPHLAAATS